ncbi:hypothetical protein SKAU_G00135000 [Synaphobranchus kaupii]|uniref:Endonuclease/exonuclease/phosphatase domain-containing protein n=1 Tax=Synaphobranchus kaupii TaxID=118154 RepID=A0A9Q1J2Q7_SYNKA|nr:hypothetical protein SKAU_G00135000 [Synaphobranchus kaupii]
MKREGEANKEGQTASLHRDTLLSSFPEDGTPVILLGDFNLQPDSSQLSSVASLLQSFALTQSPSPATHKGARPSSPSPWLTDSLRSSRTMLQAAERKWRKSRSPDDLASYHTLLAAFTAATTSAKT